MPEIKWEWKLGPQLVVSLANFFVLMVGVIGLFVKMQSDIEVGQKAMQEARKTIVKLELLVSTMQAAQAQMGERTAKLEAQVQIVLNSLQRIESRQMRDAVER